MIKCESIRTMLVCVDSCTEEVPKGRLYSAAGTEAKVFRSLAELLRIMENHLEESNFPQAFEVIKSFGETEPEWITTESSDEKIGREATFRVRVLFRQNASWQGEVTWLEGGRSHSFRSALELVFMMTSALSAKIPA